jgi:hypothetical protein
LRAKDVEDVHELGKDVFGGESVEDVSSSRVRRKGVEFSENVEAFVGGFNAIVLAKALKHEQHAGGNSLLGLMIISRWT